MGFGTKMKDCSPLYDTLVRDREFYALFGDFKGYVDFFFIGWIIDIIKIATGGFRDNVGAPLRR